MSLICPECGHPKFLAIEQVTVPQVCELHFEDGDIVIETLPKETFEHNMISSIITGYACASEECTWHCGPTLEELK
jgi:hypothetical protein